MALGGGGDRSWLEPVDSQGNRGELTGCHTGTSEILNIDNAQPGWDYLWGRNTTADIRANMRRGYQVVGAGDPELANLAALSHSNGATLDTAQLTGDVILMKIPVERLRTIREGEHQRAQAMLRSGSDEFLAKVTEAEQRMSGSRGTRFAESEHRIFVTDGTDPERSNVLDEWSPEHGILK